MYVCMLCVCFVWVGGRKLSERIVLLANETIIETRDPVAEAWMTQTVRGWDSCAMRKL